MIDIINIFIIDVHIYDNIDEEEGYNDNIEHIKIIHHRDYLCGGTFTRIEYHLSYTILLTFMI